MVLYHSTIAVTINTIPQSSYCPVTCMSSSVHVCMDFNLPLCSSRWQLSGSVNCWISARTVLPVPIARFSETSAPSPVLTCSTRPQSDLYQDTRPPLVCKPPRKEQNPRREVLLPLVRRRGQVQEGGTRGGGTVVSSRLLDNRKRYIDNVYALYIDVYIPRGKIHDYYGIMHTCMYLYMCLSHPFTIFSLCLTMLTVNVDIHVHEYMNCSYMYSQLSSHRIPHGRGRPSAAVREALAAAASQQKNKVRFFQHHN